MFRRDTLLSALPLLCFEFQPIALLLPKHCKAVSRSPPVIHMLYIITTAVVISGIALCYYVGLLFHFRPSGIVKLEGYG